MQRCFHPLSYRSTQDTVFSAHAEMFPPPQSQSRRWCGFLCTCRDVSMTRGWTGKTRGFSLHMQRCFRSARAVEPAFLVFSAHAEMFPCGGNSTGCVRCFLCTCRDVSEVDRTEEMEFEFSLCVQRCFYRRRFRSARKAVFSVLAEMFPNRTRICSGLRSFLCMCRDVSV